MYRYKVFIDEGVLITQFYGEYIADEGDISLLAISQSMELDERYAIKTVIWDLQDVTAMTLVDTDFARVALFEKELFKIFEGPGKDAAEHMKTIQIYHIQPDNSAIADIFRESLERVSTMERKTPVIDGREPKDLPELLASLDLLKLQPLIEGEWQKWKSSAAWNTAASPGASAEDAQRPRLNLGKAINYENVETNRTQKRLEYSRWCPGDCWTPIEDLRLFTDSPAHTGLFFYVTPSHSSFKPSPR